MKLSMKHASPAAPYTGVWKHCCKTFCYLMDETYCLLQILLSFISYLFTFLVCLFSFLQFFAWFLVIFVEERYISRDLFFVVTSKMPNRHVPQINQATAELHRNCRATVRPQRNWPQQSSDGKMMRAASLTFKEILAFFGHKDAYPEMWFFAFFSY